MIRIVTDSTCDLLQSEQAQLGVDVLPLTLNFAGHIYKDGIDLTHAQFYEKLAKSSKLPTTSQINPGEFAQYFEKCVAAGDEVVGIFLSGELSGTYQSAMIAANEVSPDRIFPVDSRCTTFAMGLLVREAVRMRDSGQYRGAEIAKAIALLAKRVRLFAVIDTLKYLKMGGRLDAKTGFVGELLGVKPVIAVTDGKVEVIGKTRGETGYGKALLKQCCKTAAIPIITKPASAKKLDNPAAELFSLQAAATDLYVLAYPEQSQRFGGQEWTTGPVIL